MLRLSGSTFDLRATMSRELRDALACLTTAHEDAQALHRCRVHVKRARALARVGHVCAPGLASVFNDTARHVMRELGRARHLAALEQAARGTADKSGAKQRAALNALAQQLAVDRNAAAPLDIEAARAGMNDLLALATVWPEASPRQVKRGAERVVRRASAAYEFNRAQRLLETRHAWRKRAKDRYYATLLMGQAWPVRRRRKLGERLGEILGQERDVALLIDYLKQHSVRDDQDKAVTRALNALKARRKALAHRADKIGARLHAKG